MVALPTPARDATSSIDIPSMPRSASSSSAAAMIARSACSLRGRPRCGAAPPGGPGGTAPPGGPGGTATPGTAPPGAVASSLPAWLAPTTPPALFVLTGSPIPVLLVANYPIWPAGISVRLVLFNAEDIRNDPFRIFISKDHQPAVARAGRLKPITIVAINVPACPLRPKGSPELLLRLAPPRV